MARWLWFTAAALLGVTAFAVWWAFTSPEFVAGLAAVAMGALFKAIAPAFKPRPFTDEENKRSKSGRTIFGNDR
jgi:4-hydroxybenzoate polyprenyltransferase